MTDQPDKNTFKTIMMLTDQVQTLATARTKHAQTICDLQRLHMKLATDRNIPEMRDQLTELSLKVDTLARARVNLQLTVEANAAAIATLQQKNETLCRKVNVLIQDSGDDTIDFYHQPP